MKIVTLLKRKEGTKIGEIKVGNLLEINRKALLEGTGFKQRPKYEQSWG